MDSDFMDNFGFMHLYFLDIFQEISSDLGPGGTSGNS